MAETICLIFDYDGTLHETMALYKSAVCDVIEKQKGKLLPSDTPLPDDHQFCRWIGMNAEAMWIDFLPELNSDKREQAIRAVGQTMNRLIDEKSRWYSGAEAMLDRLKEAGYRMVVLSNCTELYAKAHWEHFQMARWFEAFFASESYEDLPKERIVASLLANPEEVLQKAVCKAKNAAIQQEKWLAVIGDKGSDKKAADDNALAFVGCLYGYGVPRELEGAAALAEKPEDILHAVRLLTDCQNTFF